jgi:hypothetical protein
MVSQTLGVPNGGQELTPRCVTLVQDGEQGNNGADEAQQVVPTKPHGGLVGSPLQSVIEVITHSRGEPSHHAWVRWVSRDVREDLAASMPKLTIWAAMVRGSPRVTKGCRLSTYHFPTFVTNDLHFPPKGPTRSPVKSSSTN